MLARRTPLRRTPFRSSSALKTVTTPRRSQPKHAAPRDTGFPRPVRALAWERSAGRCEGCGTWLGEDGGQLQHRLARRAGGSRDPVISSAANAGRLCGTPQSGCHGLCEARDEHMRAAGWWLESWQDPRTEPVMLHGYDGGVAVWLGESGGYLTEAPEVAA